MSLVLATLLACQSSPHVDWLAPPQCPDLGWVTSRIATLTGPASDDDIEIVGELVLIDAGRYRLRAQLSSPSGRTSRELESDDCRVLAQAFALEAALLIAPEQALLGLGGEATDRESDGASDDVVEPVLDTDEPLQRSPSETPDDDAQGRPRLVAHVRVAPMLGVRAMRSGVDGGLAVAAGFGNDRLVGELVSSLWPLGRIHYSDDMGRGGQAALTVFTGGINLCPRSELGRVELGGCFGGEVGLVTAQPSGLQDSRRRTSATLGGRVGPRLGVRFSPAWVLVLDAALLVPVLRPGFSVRDLGVVWRVPPVGMALGLGIEWRRR